MQFAFRLGLVDIEYLVNICILKLICLLLQVVAKKEEDSTYGQILSLRTVVVDLLTSLDQSFFIYEET